MGKKELQPKKKQRLAAIIFIFLLLCASSLAVFSGTQFITRAQDASFPSVPIMPISATEQMVVNIQTALNQQQQITVSEDHINTIITYLLPESKIVESVRIATADDNTLSALIHVLWPVTMDVEVYTAIPLESGIPQMDVKEIALYGIPIPRLFWEKTLSTANSLVKRNFIKYNSRLQELTIHEEGISFQGTIPLIFLDPLFWQKQNSRAEQYTKKMNLPF